MLKFQMQCHHHRAQNTSLDRSGESVFRNLNGPAELD